ncbi:thioredoxin-like protein [Atractiella rhizophila]|nr:thioredoxin-like protein [Atractiella rhizophila]
MSSKVLIYPSFQSNPTKRQRMADKQIKLYTAAICPWAQRAALALEEVGVKYEKVEIDLQNKPSWYTSVNPASKVPVIEVGTGESATRIPESAVIVELVADLYKDSHPILPEDPIKRAEARYFVERYGQLLRGPLSGTDTSVTPQILAGVDEIQGLLKKNPGKFYDGDEFGYAEILLAPFIGRAYSYTEIGLQPAKDVFKTIETESKYQVFHEYVKNVVNRESFKKTFDRDLIVGRAKSHYNL